MKTKLVLYNTLKRRKEEFVPLNPPFAGMYVCGPTVYGDPHLGHARPAITFDVLFRYLADSGYKVRYVRNITDVGHLENDADEGEDKISGKAKLENLEPMEVAQYYTDRYHRYMEMIGVLPPSIEPRASGHIIEQINIIERIMEKGYAYESNGSVYFDVETYRRKHDYGKLSGRVLEDMKCSSRELEGQQDKRSPWDFALWKKASPSHIMRWPSPWGYGFPGWHVECSAMSVKYLGETFDIHGGGMDLLFPHHECEIAQNTAASGHEAARYWVHNNMITVNGQKMGKSLGNFITLEEIFSGRHETLEQPYSPMTVRFFILQAHYRSTLDFSNEALQAAGKGFDRLMKAVEAIDNIVPSHSSSVDVGELEDRCLSALNDDLNTPMVISALFDWAKIINRLNDGTETISASDLDDLRILVHRMVFDILGLSGEQAATGMNELVAPLVGILLDLRTEAKDRKDWVAADYIRKRLSVIGINVKDGKEGPEWEIEDSSSLRSE
ncbi:cysteinyl-trna synthetase [Holotrichia oblita]|uniref:Cysteinyl-trna synthetase n=1 Tax=Holotrichia oblita TaxID=644536 RepID=A0ACB9TRB3_HOLOL|nr:cysteinyl-trna synthetase [Holotrichia oblita]